MEASRLPKILITGAAGNLGGLLSRHLISRGHRLRLMVHRTDVPEEIAQDPHVEVVRADLRDIRTLPQAVDGVDVVVHFAGVLFAPRPDSFLPETNTRWFSNLLESAMDAGASRVILVSFPHVEGPTSVENPATGRLDGRPISVHAATRLEEEKLLFERTGSTRTTPVVLRLGMVYGRGILMVDAARWLARRRLLAVWRDPTWIQLLSTEDFLRAAEAAVTQPGVRGIYHVGDERPVTLQQFLDEACDVWGTARPLRMPVWTFYVAGWFCEMFSMIARTRSPLTRDFIRIGRVSYWGDTRRAREELVPSLTYPTLDDGRSTL